MTKFSLGHRRSAKLTPEQVFEMRRLYSEENWSQRQLCNHFDISLGQVGRIVRGESWRHYTQIPTDQELEHRMAVAPPLTPEQDAEALAAIAKLAEQNAVPPPKSEAEQNRYDLASLVEDLRKRKAEQTPKPSDPPVGGAVPQVDREETHTHEQAKDSPADPTSSVHDRDAGPLAREGGATTASPAPSGPARGPGTDEVQ